MTGSAQALKVVAACAVAAPPAPKSDDATSAAKTMTWARILYTGELLKFFLP